MMTTGQFRLAAITAVTTAALSCCCFAQAAASTDASAFAPLDQWKTAVLAGDAAGLSSLYSTNPAIQVAIGKDASDAAGETSFWVGLKARKIDLQINKKTSPQPGVQVVVFQAEVQSGSETLYVTVAQAWQQQGESWRLVVIKHTTPTHLQQPPNADKNIYPNNVDARKEIKDAEEQAAKDHKRVLLVFGANWCYDCHVLDLAFHRPDLTSVLQKNYEVVHVDVGEGDKNQDIMQQYGVPMKKGIPALAVLDSHGKLLYSQQGGEFEKARSLAPEDLLTFLNKWKPAA